MIFRRKLYNKMLRWKEDRHGESALLIKGARRVGKSTLVEEFARREYRSYIMIDFSVRNNTVDALFKDMSDLDFFFMRLQQEMNVTLHERESVIVFDEVQLQPLARQAIKHLVKDGRYDYIETGSLLTLKKNVQNILIPSEETRLTLYPLDFEEFLWATGNEVGLKFLPAFREKKVPIGGGHRKMMRDLRLYMLVGGMPQSIETYNETNNLQQVDAKKREILELYDDDFRKIDPLGRASHMMRAIPGQLNSNARRYKISSAIESRRTEGTDTVVADMEDSMVVNIAHHANDPNVGLGLSRNEGYYKMYMVDTGLFVTLAFWDKDFTDNIIYNQLLSDKLAANLGYVYENLVAQMLLAAGNRLYYYTFPTDNEKHNYEIDYLLSRGNKIVPIEVKSSGYRTHKSLDLFCEKYSSRIGERILLYTKDYQQDGPTTCLPVYFAGLL
ncbi:MAG: ATP-binding protein [Bacteroidales bacterium]|nr:ATP-binding protein [Bacteroidales bacterium]MBR3412508.1 ATP-binding protein [Bacteroidales bacterium]